MENKINSSIDYKAIVLLVDDQPMVAEAIRRMLQSECDIGFHYCEEPSKALEMAIEIKATIILQDLVMPDVDGMTLMRFYKNHPDTAKIPVLVLSSKEDPEIKSDAFSNGANDYLVKLPEPIELIARIRAHTKHYITEIERNKAYELMQKMQEELAEANKELEKHNLKLQHLSRVDGLTGIANRRSFDEAIKKDWCRAQRQASEIDISLIMIDIDFFKLYNDGYGHQQGDDCLKLVAQEISNCVKRDCDLIARYGGEEFVAVLPDTSLEAAIEVAEEMRKHIIKLAIPHEYSAHEDTITLSLGVATTIPTKNNTPEQLIEAADKALYKAKGNGRNQVMQAQELLFPEV